MRDFSPAPCRGCGKGGYSLSRKRISPLHPQEQGRGEDPSTPALPVWDVKSCGACRIRCLPSDVSKRFGLLLSSLPLCLHVATLTQSPSTIDLFNLIIACQCGLANAHRQKCVVIPVYRQSPQCGERSNAAFSTQSAAKQSSLAPHDSKARLRVVANRRRFMAKPCTPHPIPQAAQLFELQTANVRGQGGSPLAFLWGFQRGCSLWKENTPFDRQQRLRAAFPLRAVRGKNYPACKATHLYTNWCKTFRGALCQKNS